MLLDFPGIYVVTMLRLRMMLLRMVIPWRSFSVARPVDKVAKLPKGSRRFIHLTRLVWEWDANVEMSLFHLNIVLDVAPFLEELKLFLSTHVKEPPPPPPQTPSKARAMLPKLPYPHLRMIEVSGFCFNLWQTEIVAYLVTIAAKLESITLKKGIEASRIVSEEIQLTVMKNLREEIPANVKFDVS